MPTTGDVLDQHLKCFGENDLDGVLADRPVTWVTIEEVCSVEWSISGQPRTTEAVPALAASKNKTNILEEA